MAGKVFGIARLLADQHDPGSLQSLAEHGLRRVTIQVTAGASGSGLAQRSKRLLGRDLDADPDIFVTHRSCPMRQRILYKRDFRAAGSTANGSRLFLPPLAWQSAEPAPFHGDLNADQEPASGNARAPRGVPERPGDQRRRGPD